MLKLEVMDNSWQIFGSTVSRDFVLKTKKGNIVFKGKQMLINSVPASVKE